jgi:hypothetical protein
MNGWNKQSNNHIEEPNIIRNCMCKGQVGEFKKLHVSLRHI